ncbi:MAG: hypothetical protein IPP68_12395 [Elusimicrobia bacterium]|nr:hypothetical protein [Elusimicrobiota bacterium]
MIEPRIRSVAVGRGDVASRHLTPPPARRCVLPADVVAGEAPRLLSAVKLLPVAPAIVTSPSVPPVRVKAPAPSMVWLKLTPPLPPRVAAGVGAVRPSGCASFRSTAPVTVTVSALVVMVVKAAAALPATSGIGIGRRAGVQASWFWL